jgi:hypothetical protein
LPLVTLVAKNSKLGYQAYKVFLIYPSSIASVLFIKIVPAISGIEVSPTVFVLLKFYSSFKPTNKLTSIISTFGSETFL